MSDRLFGELEGLIRASGIESDADLGHFLEHPPPAATPDALKQLRHMYEAGAWVIVESAIADLPADLRWLYESGAVTLEELASLHGQLGVTSLADLTAAIGEQSVRALQGFDEDTERRIGLVLGRIRESIPRVPLGRAYSLAEPLLADIRALPGIDWALPVGSLRRGQDSVGDIELVAASDRPEAAIEAVANDAHLDRVLHRSPRRLYVLTNRSQIGIRFPEPANAGSVLLHLTGSMTHFAQLRMRAAERGLRLSADGLRGSDGRLRAAASEEEIYAALDLPFIPPEIRNGEDEITAADNGLLPKLVRAQDIRGDLHMHSQWSDGRDSIEDMVRACRGLEYEYVAITDHSPYSRASQSLTIQTVKRQADEIAAIRDRFPEITILHGCEVDILPGGRLDFPDRVLEGFDIVLASLHHRNGDGPAALLSRYEAAMRHPLVSLITHPTNRLVPHRRGYEIDYDRLFEAAVETGTLLEIDGAPAHLDMDGVLARRAVAAGTMVAVSSDCHRSDFLGRQMQLGVLTARRGWVEARHVINTRPLADVKAFLAGKRRR